MQFKPASPLKSSKKLNAKLEYPQNMWKKINKRKDDFGIRDADKKKKK